MEFFVGDPAFDSLLALFKASTENLLAPISHPAHDPDFRVTRDPDIRRGEARLAHDPDIRRNEARLTRDAGGALREAAVLIPATRPATDNSPSQVVLTVRSENLKSHAGQISLPGGSRDAADSDLAATALREAEEEIGLPRGQVEVIGQLGPMDLPSGFQVTPIIGLIPPGLEFTPCSREVADIFQTPLELILDPDAYVRCSYRFGGVKRSTLELCYEDYRIWGATAAILHRLAGLCSHSNDMETPILR